MKKILLLIFLLTFSLGYSQPGASPTNPPLRNSWDVFSIFSDSYTNQTGVQFLNFGGSTINADFTPPGGTPAKYYTGHSYSGMQVNTAGSLDVSQMTHLHFDVWSPNYNSLAIKLESSTATARELAVTGTIIPSSTTRSQWISIDLALSTYNLGNILTSLKYIVPVTFGQNATLYIDNIYFYRAATTQPPTFGTFTVPAKVVGDVPFTITPPTSNSLGAFTYTSSNTAVATVSGSTITVVGAGTSTITATQAANGIYGTGTATATLTVTVPPPPSAPTPPARNSFDVVSLYSDSYTATSGATWQAGADVLTSAGNSARYFNGFTLARLAFAARSISAMTTLHIDVYTVNQNQLWFEINGNRKVVSSIPLNGWASFDIPLSDYIGLNLGNVSFFDLNNPTGAAAPVKVVYLDNIYFYRAATDAPPTIGALTVPSPKTVGDAPFTLTNPTSNSSGAWTYSSSPAGVVTFSGNTATIVTGGTTTITATQAAVTGVYGAGTATASLVVNFAAPGASPIPPVRDAASVVSMYTGTPTIYANGTTAVQAGWSAGSTNSNFNFANGTNTCIQVNNLGFFGFITNGANFSVTGMTKLHVDIYLNAPLANMFIVLLAPGDQMYNSGPLVAGWNSLDINLSSYASANLANINGIKFEQNVGSAIQMYLDNVYFYYTPTTPTISNFAAVGKIMGAAPFTLGATSDSPATITYTSSNTNVATISGNTVTVVGVGTSTLTASQVATGTYAAGSLNATLTVGSNVPLTGPTTPPARNAWDVKSIYSTAYTNVSGVSFSNFGSAAVITDETLADASVVKKYTSHTYSGIQVAASSGFDVAPASSGMTTLHMDIFSPNFTSMKVKLEAFNGSAVELNVPGGTSQYSWISYDIPLSTYSAVDLANLKFIVPVSSGNATLYVTNVYFYRPATAQPPTLGEFTVPAKVIGDANFDLTAPTSNSGGAFTYTSSNTAVATIIGSTVTVVGAGTSTITATQAADGIYGAGTKIATLSVTPPAAPTPIARNAWDVISLYSNTYATSSSASWGVGTDVSISGNNTRFLSGSPTYRLAFTPTNVSAMTTLHIDVYALNQNSWQFRLNDKAVTVGTPVNGWTSVDILLSAYVPSGLNLSAVSYFDFFNPNGANPNSSYVDNIYFYRAATDAPPTIGALSVPSPQVLGNAPFVLTNPSSDSSGAWTYSSNPAGIVTFSGNTATIVGGGTTTITATQAAVPGAFGPGSVSASLVVTYPAPGPSPVPPARIPAKVVSMFTGTPSVYANPVGYNMVRAGWSGAALSTISNGSNTCLQVDNFGFLGYVTDAEPVRFSAVGMTNLHVDVYLNSPIANMFVFLLSNGDHIYNTGPLVAGWNSLNISLSNYPGANLASIYGFKFEHNQGAARQIYLDNIYFSDDLATYYQDSDADGYGNLSVSLTTTMQPVGYVTNSTDCNDTLASVNPGAVDVCYDGVDNDCDGTVDNNCIPLVAEVQSSQCGQTLNNIDDYVYANLVSGVQGYRFKVTNLSNNQVQTIDRFLRVFRITQLPNYAFNTEYQVEVAVRKNNVWQPYNGAPCTVKTPAATTQLINCGGASLTAMTDIIYANSVQYATGYQFKVTNVLDPSDTRTINRSLREFRMSLLPGITFNTPYYVSVAIRNTDGVTYLPYGQDCEVITPSFPASNLIDSQCDDYLVPSNSTILYAESYSGAQGYRFLLENIGLGYDQAVDRQLRTFRLSDFPGLSPGSTYAVRVALKINGEWGSYSGKTCSIIVPGGARSIDKEETVAKGSFSVVAYPNPFANIFAINVQTTSQEVVQVKVYDMLGRMIEQREAVASEMEKAQFGNNYPAGVYTIIVNQGEITESLRMIKR